jgi:hypothetical protein
MAEWTLAYFCQLSKNTNKRQNPPPVSTILINRWFEPQEPHSRKNERGHPDWPDLIEYDREGGQAWLVWFGQKRFEHLDQTEINDLSVR